jgi:uncharacterized protein (TIGR02284 family)
MQNKDVISVLNNLIETCKDGEQGFKTAAENVKDSALKSKFLDYSRQRSQMSSELQAEVRQLGGDPERSGSISGSLHRGWVDIKSAITGKDDDAILAEAERGEDVAKKTFETALQQTLPASTQGLVQRQTDQVRRAHDEVRDLRDRRHVAR